MASGSRGAEKRPSARGEKRARPFRRSISRMTRREERDRALKSALPAPLVRWDALQRHLSRAVFGEALAAGLVVNAPVPGVVRLMPPFIVTEADCDEAVALLGVAIGRAGASARKSTGERG